MSVNICICCCFTPDGSCDFTSDSSCFLFVSSDLKWIFNTLGLFPPLFSSPLSLALCLLLGGDCLLMMMASRSVLMVLVLVAMVTRVRAASGENELDHGYWNYREGGKSRASFFDPQCFTDTRSVKHRASDVNSSVNCTNLRNLIQHMLSDFRDSLTVLCVMFSPQLTVWMWPQCAVWPEF